MVTHGGFYNQPIEILLVEDNPGDVRLTMEIFRESGFECQIAIVNDGVEAMAYLHRIGEFRHAQLPDLILLDLNLPRKDGRAVLTEIKSDPDLQHIPVIVLTSSDAEEDICHAYKLHANCYLAKPANFEELLLVMRLLKDFWFTAAKLPPRKRQE